MYITLVIVWTHTLFCVHRFFPPPYSISSRMIAQASMSPYMSPLSTYQVLKLSLWWRTCGCEHIKSSTFYCLGFGSLRGVSQVCDEGHCFCIVRVIMWSLEIASAQCQCVYIVCLLMAQVQNPSWVPHQPYIMQHPVRATSVHVLIIAVFISFFRSLSVSVLPSWNTSLRSCSRVKTLYRKQADTVGESTRKVMWN